MYVRIPHTPHPPPLCLPLSLPPLLLRIFFSTSSNLHISHPWSFANTPVYSNPFNTSVTPSIYLSIYLSIHPSIYLSIHPSIYPFHHPPPPSSPLPLPKTTKTAKNPRNSNRARFSYPYPYPYPYPHPPPTPKLHHNHTSNYPHTHTPTPSQGNERDDTRRSNHSYRCRWENHVKQRVICGREEVRWMERLGRSG